MRPHALSCPTADLVVSRLNAADFERRSCGHGTKGERHYDWAAVAVTFKDHAPAEGIEGPC